MAVNYLFDTNPVIYYLGGIVLNERALEKIESIYQKGSNISLITKLELLGYNFTDTSNEKLTQEFVDKSVIYPIDADTEVEIIKLRKSYKIKLPDAIIAATAIINNFTLLTGNITDFKNIASLKTVNPFDWQ